jgi:hypothetical protein
LSAEKKSFLAHFLETAGLPDGIFLIPKISILALEMDNFGIFHGKATYFVWPFRIFRSRLVYFFPVLLIGPRKLWQPCKTVGRGGGKTIWAPISKLIAQS